MSNSTHDFLSFMKLVGTTGYVRTSTTGYRYYGITAPRSTYSVPVLDSLERARSTSKKDCNAFVTTLQQQQLLLEVLSSTLLLPNTNSITTTAMYFIHIVLLLVTLLISMPVNALNIQPVQSLPPSQLQQSSSSNSSRRTFLNHFVTTTTTSSAFLVATASTKANSVEINDLAMPTAQEQKGLDAVRQSIKRLSS